MPPFIQSPKKHITASGAAGSEAYIEAAIARLRAAGLRITQARIKLLTELSRRGEPMTIDELHQALGPDEWNIVTVYRCMAAFEDHDVVRRSYRHSGTTLYERKLGEPPRYRVVCKVTNRVDEIEPESAIRLEEAIREAEGTLRQRGYTNISHIVEFFGVYAPSPAKLGREQAAQSAAGVTARGAFGSAHPFGAPPGARVEATASDPNPTSNPFLAAALPVGSQQSASPLVQG